MPKLKKGARNFLYIIFALVIVGGLYWLGNTDAGKDAMETIAPNSGESAEMIEEIDGKETFRFGVVTWGGYAGGQYFNNGFPASKESRFWKDYGIPVEFIVMDDFNASREALKADEIDAVWVTADAYPTEAQAMVDAGYDPVFFFQADWSRGGDAIVVRPGINNMNDIRGKSVAVALGTPSHTFLLKMLESSDIPYTDVQIMEAPSAIDASAMFKAQQVDCAVVWSPDDADCIRSVPGSKILISTKTATNIIADGFYAKRGTLEKRREDVKKIVEGWLRGSAEINSDPNAKAKAIQILMDGLHVDHELATTMINNVRLTTYGDNLDFFGINRSYRGVTGEQLYRSMSNIYSRVKDKAGIALAPSRNVSWQTVSSTEFIQGMTLQNNGIHASEMKTIFSKPTQSDVTAQGITSKKVQIQFPSGSATLTEDAKGLIDSRLANIAQEFASARLRVEGHTDNIGSDALNKSLSQRRAQSVASYLANKYGFDINRFTVVGFGEEQPIADNSTDFGRAQNRRVELEITQ